MSAQIAGGAGDSGQLILINRALAQGKQWEERRQVLQGWDLNDDGPHNEGLLQHWPSNT